MSRLVLGLIRLLATAVASFEFELRAARQRRIDRSNQPLLAPTLFPDDPADDERIVRDTLLRETLRLALRKHHPDQPPFEA